MSKINFEDLQENYKVALAQKETNPKDVASAIIDNELSDKFNSYQKEKEQISSSEELEKYQKRLESLFYEVYKIITAPGVQKFIDWLSELSSKELEVKISNHFTEFLIGEYATYDKSIKNILKNKDVIEPNSSLFENIKKHVKENINKRIINSFNTKEKVHEELPDFIDELDDLLIGLSEIDELSYTDIKDFYTINIQNRNDDDYIPEIDEDADFYYDLIKQVVEKKDFLTRDKDKIQLSTIVDNVQSSIDDIIDSIETIKTIEVSAGSDDKITTLYNKFEKSFKFNNIESVSDYIQESISETWKKTISAYSSCQSFYSEFNFSKVEKLKSNRGKWMDFEFAIRIDNYISNIETIITGNPMHSFDSDDISKIKSRFVKTADKIGNLDDDNPKDDVVGYFQNIASDYKEKKIEILKKLKIENSEIDKIEGYVKEINNNIELFRGYKNLLDALKEAFVEGILGSYEYIQKGFTSAIENSDVIEKSDIDFLYNISNEGDILDKSDLETNIERIKILIELDLININLSRNI